jgi:hypothetical protein
MAKFQNYLWDNITWPRKNYDLSYLVGDEGAFKGLRRSADSQRETPGC